MVFCLSVHELEKVALMPLLLIIGSRVNVYVKPMLAKRSCSYHHQAGPVYSEVPMPAAIFDYRVHA